MVVKDKVGRKRYIIAYIKLRKRDADNLLKTLATKYNVPITRIIHYHGFLIIRTIHREKDKVINILQYNNFKTYKTTGSVKKAKAYFYQLIDKDKLLNIKTH